MTTITAAAVDSNSLVPTSERDEHVCPDADTLAEIDSAVLTEAEHEEEVRCSALGMEGPNAKQHRYERFA